MAQDSSKKKILVVDDEALILDALKVRLEASGYEVLTALNGQEALDKARTLNPDLIILDVLLPKVDGYEVARLLKFDTKYKHIPIIMLTAKTQDSDKKIGRDVRADEYITKPFDAKELVELIKKHIEKKRGEK